MVKLGIPAVRSAEQVGETEAKERSEVATWLATGVTVLRWALALFGGLTGAVARMVRNNAADAKTVVIMVIVAVGLALLARLVSSSADPRRVGLSSFMFVVSLIVLIWGLVWSVSLMVNAIDTDDRPSIS